MKHYFFFRVIIYAGIIFISGSSSQDPITKRTCWDDGEAEGHRDPYFVGDGFTCCNNEYMQHSLLPKNEYWRKCLSQQHGNPDDDIPKTMWNAYWCEITGAGSIKPNNASYQAFLSFFMRNYPESMRSLLQEKGSKCDIPANLTNSPYRLKFYEECFWKAEEMLCLEKATVNTVIITKPNETICDPVESLPPPNHSFLTFAKPCCKGQELPYPLFDIFMDFERFDIADKVIGCAEGYRSKLKSLKELGPNEIDLDGPLAICQVACVHEVDGFKGKYNAKFQDLLNFKMKTVSNNTKAKLVKNIKSYTATMFEMFNSNKTVPLDKAGDEISKMNESYKILNYCKFHFEATAEAYRALYEYCYNADYGKQFRDDIVSQSFREEED